MDQLAENMYRCIDLLERAGMGKPGKPNTLVDMVQEIISERERLQKALKDSLLLIEEHGGPIMLAHATRLHDIKGALEGQDKNGELGRFD